MPDYSDLLLRLDGTSKGRLLYDSGRQLVAFDITESGLTATGITSSEGLKVALSTPGRYQLVAGTYEGNFRATASDVTILCDSGAALVPQDPSGPTLSVFGSGLTWRG